MSGLPPTLNPTLAGGVLTLAGRQIQGQYSWAARPTDKFTVDSVDTTLHVAYCRRAGDLVPNNEYPFPYPSNLTLHPGDNVIVEWDPSGPFIVGGGSTGAGNGEVIQHNGLDVGEEPGLNFRDSNPVAFNIVDDTADHRVNLVAAAPLPSEVHLRPGDGFEFLPTQPPELPPIAEALGTGTGPGGLPYYALLYTTAGDPTELGPISYPVDGTTAVAIAIPNIPAENDKATGQILYRSDDFGQTWGLIHTYADLTSHVFTDTGVALGAAPTTVATIAQVKRSYTDAIHGPAKSNDSNLGLSGVNGGLKVGNVDRVPMLPDGTTTKILPCPPPQVTVSVSPSAGPGAGPGDRQYMIVYHTAAGDSAKGPPSRWVEGTSATGVAVPPVPTTPAGVWGDVTGQMVCRTKEGGGPFWVVQDYPGSLTLQGFIDTTPDSGLTVAYDDLPAVIQSQGGGVDVQKNDVDVATEPSLDFEDSASLHWAITDDPANTRVKVSAAAVVDIEKNDVNVASEPIVDFEDSATVTWTVTDDPTNTRVKVSAAATGGGGSAPPSNGAIYNIGSDFDAIASGSTTYYIPWDTILMGADLYLDVGHTDGLTIPADGAGDYTVNTLLRFNTQGFAGTGWSVQWFLTIEVWRSGSQILFLLQDDIYQHPLDHDGFPILDEDSELPFQMSAVLPALLVGDVVKIGWQYFNGGSLASGPHTPSPGDQVIESGPYTYISIGRIGVTP